ncbi:FAD-binding protein [Treponema ruminis]|uniref:Thioredoxin reductase (NADPH) n=1 Tax=Treponema ruminis TaxID=744515 RepID=A0A7W8LN80_9SPIR|nr:FAD-dependent oxidoreductase [Treponema ruminis]MBB5227314.1 thioredoxin reductase (NADPH) [Treponema ruminis]QSI01172.1 FAD-binding protein [Treponema ruminis]
MNFDIIIIGAGPAGISAALYGKRANLNVAVIYSGESQLEKAHKIDNYYGFPEGITGPDLYANGITQAKNLGIEVIQAEVTHIEMIAPPPKAQYSVKAGGIEYSAPSVILATGNKKLRPPIEGIVDFEGKGVSYCAICDGFFYRKKTVAVIGNGTFAAEEASHLAHLADSVTILTDGKDDVEVRKELEKTPELAAKIKIDSRKVSKIIPNAENTKVGGLIFADGENLTADGIFVALGSAGAADFAKKLGLMLNGDSIATNEKMATNAPGIFSCGNANGGLLQVCKAVYEGGVAGLSAVDYIRNLKKGA